MSYRFHSMNTSLKNAFVFEEDSWELHQKDAAKSTKVEPVEWTSDNAQFNIISQNNEATNNRQLEEHKTLLNIKQEPKDDYFNDSSSCMSISMNNDINTFKCKKENVKFDMDCTSNGGHSNVNIKGERPHKKQKTTSSGKFKDTFEEAIFSCKSEIKLDPKIVCHRQQQIVAIKNTNSYGNYLRTISRDKRSKEDPSTPDKHSMYSNQDWDEEIEQWKLRLEMYNPENKRAVKSENVEEDLRSKLNFKKFSTRKLEKWTSDNRQSETFLCNTSKQLEYYDNTNSTDSTSSQSHKSAKRTLFKRDAPYDRPENDSPVKNKKSCQKEKPNNKIEYETDPEVLSRRQKQIDFGKNTIGYDNYVTTVQRDERTKEDPITPNKYIKYSRRAWDGLIRQWRLRLHKYDPE